MRLTAQLLVLTIFFVSTFAQFANSFSEQPTCAENPNAIGYCEKQKERCVEEFIENVNCGNEQCKCLKEIEVETPSCKEYVDNVCEYIKNRHLGSIATLESVINVFNEEIMKHMQEPIESLKDSFFRHSDDYSFHLNLIRRNITSNDLLVWSKIAPAVLIDWIIRNAETKKQQLIIEKLETILKVIEEIVYSRTGIPFNDYHCGYHLGDFPRVILRAISAFTSPQTAGQFNHCCAISRDCMNNKMNKSGCQQSFDLCTQNIASSLEGEKSTVVQLKNMFDDSNKLDVPQVYRISDKTLVTYSPYSDYFKREFQGFGINSISEESIYLLEPDVSYGEEFKNGVGLAYKHCRNVSITISSFVSISMICNQNPPFSTQQCDSKQSGYLPEVQKQNQKCQEAVLSLKNFPESIGTSWSKSVIITFIKSLLFEMLLIGTLWLIKKGYNAWIQYRKGTHQALQEV